MDLDGRHVGRARRKLEPDETSTGRQPLGGKRHGQAPLRSLLPALDGLTIEYGGTNGYGNLHFSSADVTLTDCTSSYSSNSGLYAASSTVTVSGSASSST